ncbi:hypothetical protein J2X36_002178 [Methylobacterium sp. BE186]|uniref:DUF6511 domain-containing protein n=1 Tax=Methylobacterium sp. BE186 TaxID=2817715 RepID=UPI00285A5A68|nr:DUF6511 domain-containing protein [Methylobacterium sp. BE186]MDR7037431.1 hypothetical protein [Methylobacterium sp. BE186]
MNAVSRIKGDREPVICGVCRRRAIGLGWAGRQGHPVMWLCDSPVCGTLARSVYEMPKVALDRFEQAARDEAGDMAGAYLESIGKTDLARLTEEEWKTFLHQVLVGFEASLRRRFLENAAPF